MIAICLMEQLRRDPDDRYSALALALYEALCHASSGKGHLRHDSGERFEDQPICHIARKLGSVCGPLQQAVKKTLESRRLTTREAKLSELYGAINYLAAAIVLVKEGLDD